MNILSQALPLKPFLNCFQMVKKIPQINVYINVPFNERIKQMENFTSGLLHTLGFLTGL